MTSGRLLIPDDEGVLVPRHASFVDDLVPPGPTETVLALAANSGGSGLGMSHFSSASRCGRRARLSMQRQAEYRERGAELPATKNHFVIGSVYHKLHELARTEHGQTLDYNEQWKNPSVAEGVRLFRGWMHHWGRDFWGRTLAVEQRLEDITTFVQELDALEGPDRIAHFYGEPIPVTGALDMVVEMDEAACMRAVHRGLELDPGRYVIDWKTADAPNDGTQYAEGTQALWYCHLWNLHHPDEPVEGIIFDIVYKRGRRKDRSVLVDDFGAYFVPAGLESVDVLRGMVQQGHRNVVEDIPNRSECVTFRGEVCSFRTSGACDAL